MATAISSYQPTVNMVDVMMLMRVLIVKVMATAISLTTNRGMVYAMMLIKVLIVKVCLLQSLLPLTVIWLMQ